MVRIVEIILIAPNDQFRLCVHRFVGGMMEVSQYGRPLLLHMHPYVDP